jgi:hypothetical protein
MGTRPLSAGLFPLSLAGALVVSGCCGGYSVVRTTVMSRVDLRAADDGGGSADELVSSGTAYVLHYSRLGEPPNTCDSGVQYLEKLWIKVPSITPGKAYAVGEGGAAAIYSRDQGGAVVRASKITGSVRINEVEGAEVMATLSVSITLRSGEVVELDDDYEFHPHNAR